MPKEAKEKELVIFDTTEYNIDQKIPENRNPNKSIDPLNINPRLARWASEIIENRHVLTPSEQVRALAAIARIQYLFMKLREETEDERSRSSSGTEVKRFAKAFAANAGRRRKSIARKSVPSSAAIAFKDDDDELEY